ncbi:MAG: right-handed parallel beta-helix repeat-containing protein [Planctomycetota bacterium]
MRSLCTLLFILMMSTPLSAAIIRVPQDYSTIQEAIDAATDFDEIIVAPGTYVEQLKIMSKSPILRSEGGPEVTVLRTSSTEPVIRILGTLADIPFLSGFTISECSLDNHHCVIECSYASPEIRDFIIKDCQTGSGGFGISLFQGNAIVEDTIISGNLFGYIGFSPMGAIQCSRGSPKIRRNTITGNTFGYQGDSGAGVYCEYTQVTIEENTIEDNAPGGIYLYNSDALIRANKITGCNGHSGIYCMGPGDISIVSNIISGGVNACGIMCFLHASPKIENNMIYDNASDVHPGGGIHCCFFSSPTILHNTLFGNSAPKGGAISSDDYSWPWVANSILWENSAAEGPEIYLGNTNGPSALSIASSDVQGGEAMVHTFPDSYLDWGDHMIDADPVFADPTEFDLHLLYTSPCRDAAESTLFVPPFNDFEGDPRYNQVADIGADEFARHLYYTGDATPGGTVTVKVLDVPNTSPVYLWASAETLFPPIHTMYGYWHLQFPLILDLNLGIMLGEGKLEYSYTFPGNFSVPCEIPLQSLSGSLLTNLLIVSVE